MSRADERIAERLGFWVERRQIERAPSAWQVKVGWLAMLPITLSESERERALSRSTWLGQIPIRVPLQVAFHPRALLVDTGITQSARSIVRHLLSVFHEDAFLGYDLQLLATHPGGLGRLAEEAAGVAGGEGARSRLLRRLVGDASYHARLVTLADAAAQGRFPDPLDLDPRFASLVGFARFCAEMPEWPAREFYGFDLRWVRGSERGARARARRRER